MSSTFHLDFPASRENDQKGGGAGILAFWQGRRCRGTGYQKFPTRYLEPPMPKPAPASVTRGEILGTRQGSATRNFAGTKSLSRLLQAAYYRGWFIGTPLKTRATSSTTPCEKRPRQPPRWEGPTAAGAGASSVNERHIRCRHPGCRPRP